MQLSERYRPKNWDAFIGQDRAIGRLRAAKVPPTINVIAQTSHWCAATLDALLAAELGRRLLRVGVAAVRPYRVPLSDLTTAVSSPISACCSLIASIRRATSRA